MKLKLFRLSFKEKADSDMFEMRQRDGQKHTRETWLKTIFSKQFSFYHQKKEFVFYPIDISESGIKDKKLILGWVARDKQIHERTPPSEGLMPSTHKSWQAALIAIDPTAHTDGQKVAFQQHDIGVPVAILTSMLKHQSSAEAPFSFQVYAIKKEGSFLKFINANPSSINEIIFDVAVPNMFNSADEFTKEQKELRDRANVNRVKSILTSDGVINFEKSNLKQVGEYVEKGGGKMVAKSIDGEKYDSEDDALMEYIDMAGEEVNSQGFWKHVLEGLGRIFK